jgi:hypothetical protein
MVRFASSPPPPNVTSQVTLMKGVNALHAVMMLQVKQNYEYCKK